MKSFRLVILILNLLALSCKQSEEKEVYRYSTGEIKEEFEIKKGKRHGLAHSFYQNGKLKAVGFYKNGIPDSCYVHYYENGNKETEGCFDKKGIRTGERKFYFESGELEQIEYLNGKGKVIDYVAYNKDGTRNFRANLVIFESESDTIKLGEYYEAKVRLANRKYNYTNVILGDPRDNRILKNQILPRKDSITSLLKIQPDKEGEYLIEGVVVDINVNFNNTGQATVLDHEITKFRKPIWVIPQQSL